jgi:DNA-binding CsgD family transcriptional regulator
MTWQDVTYPDDLEADLELAGRVLAGEISSYSLEKRYLRQCGSVVWANVTVSLRRGVSGQPDCFFSILEDITELKIDDVLSEPLTDRELEVLSRVAAGRSDPQVVEDLRYSLGTVKRDLRSVFRKLGVANRKEAAKRAVQIGLVTP